MKKPIWNKLKDFKCPKCGEYLNERTETLLYECKKCDFVIGKGKFEDIINNKRKPLGNVTQEEDNQEALNRL